MEWKDTVTEFTSMCEIPLKDFMIMTGASLEFCIEAFGSHLSEEQKKRVRESFKMPTE